ncbi:MAG TPA: hypothetical protein DCY85_00615 [Firmicutes bacterium]|jgi:DNA invertase Pin-like site-specific DNA recombinase|nr:hypothetical protein [Bacillota bacterium]
MKKVVAYCRVDGPTSENTQELLNAQKCRLKAHAQKHNIEITAFYEDTGFPGYTLERPGLKRLMNDAANSEIGSIWVVNYNRLFRGQMPQRLKVLQLDIHSIYDHKFDIYQGL